MDVAAHYTEQQLQRLADGTEARSLLMNGEYSYQLLYSGDGNFLGTRSNEVALWDLRTGEKRQLSINASVPRGWALSPDGQTIYVEKNSSRISRFNTSDWSVRKDWPLRIAHFGDSNPDGSRHKILNLARHEA